ncbi:MAG TPA: purine-nucleoside phosphorylase [Streptosporangiaceae bacterium]|nr:purine-nucleoside phosphorylase [Streptosporangiaceae bacterium]
MSPADPLAPATAALRPALMSQRPVAALVLGSGLGGVAHHIASIRRIPFAEIPGFAPATVAGHGGELVAGTMAGRPILAQLGRLHLYEGWDAETTALPVRVYAELGVETLLVTNAAGGIRRPLAAGRLLVIADHLNLTFRNPLVGPVRGPETRFPDGSALYDPALRRLARRVATDLHIALEEGVYAGVLGPSYETPAEIRMLERMGADVVGMSTVVETIAARARGLRCLGLSVVTNPAAGLGRERLTHEEVTSVSARLTGELARLLEGIVAAL